MSRTKPILRTVLALCLLLPAWPTAGQAQGSLCNPCVDPPVQGGRSGPNVVTPEHMRELGVISVDEMIRQLPGNVSLAPDADNPYGRAFGDARVSSFGYRSRHFQITGDFNDLTAPIGELAEQFDAAYDYVAARMGMAPADDRQRIPLIFAPPARTGSAAGCPQRGRASAASIEIFADATTSRAQLLGVLAHEVAHVLTFSWPAGFPSSVMPAEGIATWAAGRYVTDWYGSESLTAAVTGLIGAGEYASISTGYGPYYTVPADFQAEMPPAEECFANRDRLYLAWGAFMAWLIDEHGQEALARLFASPGTAISATSIPDAVTDRIMIAVQDGDRIQVLPAAPWAARNPTAQLDYAGVYGKGLAELEADWLATLPP